MKTDTSKTRISLLVVCPDYDEDCLDMTHEEAVQCYEGFPDNPHLMALGGSKEGMGVACGHCPIIARSN